MVGFNCKNDKLVVEEPFYQEEQFVVQNREEVIQCRTANVFTDVFIHQFENNSKCFSNQMYLKMP